MSTLFLVITRTFSNQFRILAQARVKSTYPDVSRHSGRCMAQIDILHDIKCCDLMSQQKTAQSQYCDKGFNLIKYHRNTIAICIKAPNSYNLTLKQISEYEKRANANWFVRYAMTSACLTNSCNDSTYRFQPFSINCRCASPLILENTTKAEKGLPTSNFQLQTSDSRLPTSDFRLPTSDFR